MFIQWIKNKVFTYMQSYPQSHLVLVMDNVSIHHNKVFGDCKNRCTDTAAYYIYRKFNAFVMLLALGLNIFLLIYWILIQLKLLSTT